MRMTRRGCFAAHKEPKYIWYVYNFAYGIDESSATSGSFNGGYINANIISKMASTSFTANASGFTLTNPTSTYCNNLTVGQYLVDVSTSNHTATTGQYLYRVTNVISYINIAVSYTRYSVAAMKGTTQVDTVSSDTMDYPMDGPQGTLWYVMVKGEKPMYVWDVFNYTSEDLYVLTSQGANTVSGPASGNFKYGSEIVSNPNSTDRSVRIADKKILNTYQYDSTTPSNSQLQALVRTLSGCYIQKGGSGTALYAGYNPTKATYQSSNKYIAFSCSNYFRRELKAVPSKGAYTGTTVESADQAAYPQDGVSGDRWYTYSHSYSKPFDDR